MSQKVLLVDDHRILRQGLKALLEHQSDLQVIGEAEDGREAMAMVQSLRPDIVLMDISMPNLNGIDATRRILETSPATKVIALTALSSSNLVRDILKAGAARYILKDSAVDDLIKAIQTVLAGRVFISPRVAANVVDGLMNQQVGQVPEVPSVFNRLTPREREVLQLMAEGKATKEVARDLKVSVKTAETHRRAIMEKLDIHSVAELTKYAVREGLTSLD